RLSEDLFAVNLRVERSEMRVKFALLLLLLDGHSFARFDTAIVDHLQQNAGLCAFCVDEGLAGASLRHKQLDYCLVRRESGFKEAFLFLFASCHLSAQCLHERTCTTELLASLAKAIECEIGFAGCRACFPQEFFGADL